MKIIDLYVMVSKGEQPKKFKYRNEWWAYSVSDYDFRTLKQEYRDADMPTYEYLMCIIDTSNLNDEVEIVQEDYEITKLENEKAFYCYAKYEEYKHEMDKIIYILRGMNLTEEKIDNMNTKINELIDEVNKLKGKSE